MKKGIGAHGWAHQVWTSVGTGLRFVCGFWSVELSASFLRDASYRVRRLLHPTILFPRSCLVNNLSGGDGKRSDGRLGTAGDHTDGKHGYRRASASAEGGDQSAQPQLRRRSGETGQGARLWVPCGAPQFDRARWGRVVELSVTSIRSGACGSWRLGAGSRVGAAVGHGPLVGGGASRTISVKRRHVQFILN